MERKIPRNKSRSKPVMLPLWRPWCRCKKRSMTVLPTTFGQKHHAGYRHGASPALVAATGRAALRTHRNLQPPKRPLFRTPVGWYDVFMSRDTEALLDAFEHLPVEEKR